MTAQAATKFKYQRKEVNAEPYFERGDYLVQIKDAKLNKRDEPFISFQVTRSHHGRRVNQYYSVNFYINGEKPAGAQMWDGKFNELLHAVEIENLTSLKALHGRTVCMHISKTGFSPLPNFKHPNKFTNIQPVSTASPTPDVEQEPDITDDSIPF